MSHSGFPHCKDGNVEIDFHWEREKYVVHNYVLALHSPWFKASLSDRWIPESERSIINGKHHWVYELRFEKGSYMGTLVRKTSTDTSESTDTEPISGSEAWNPEYDENRLYLLKDRLEILKAHKDMLSSLYHIKPKFDETSLEEAKAAIVALVEIAEYYDCREVVNLRIKAHLAHFYKDILHECCSDPLEMLAFAIQVKCDWMFMEAATNLLGRSRRFFQGSLDKLTAIGLADLFKAKRETFTMSLKSAEINMFSMSAHTEDKDAWSHFALAFFREWLKGEINSGKGSGLGPGYANLYHRIAKEKFTLSYPPHQKMVQTYADKVYSNVQVDAEHPLQEEIAWAWSKAAGILSPLLLQDHTRRQDKREDMHRSLLFMTIKPDELPWAEKAVTAHREIEL